jgi:hypothetical protein
MSRRAEYRRAARARARNHEDDDVAIVAGWAADKTALAEARKGTHDAVINLLGRARRGGVEWRQLTGDDALNIIGELVANLDPDDVDGHDHYARIEGLLRARGGWLVIASAPGDPTIEP